MFKLNGQNKQLIPLRPINFSQIGILERFDIQEWIGKAPNVLGEDLLIVAKEFLLPSGRRLDLLALDRRAKLVVIELKRDHSGSQVEMQAIKYASYISNFTTEAVFNSYSKTHQISLEQAQARIEEFVDSIELLNESQRIILVAQEFHPEIISAVLWLRDHYQVDIKCVKLKVYLSPEEEGGIYIVPEVIIPLPEAKDYIERKEDRKRDDREPIQSSFSLEVGNFSDLELEKKLRMTFNRQSSYAETDPVFKYLPIGRS